jgi:hypothetical protein
MDEKTYTSLNRSKFYLYGFKAVRGTDAGARPLVWFRIDPGLIMQNTRISWSNRYQAYISGNKIVSDMTIFMGTPKDIEPGQVWKVGDQCYQNPQAPTAISIENRTGVEYTCGISQGSNNGNPAPYCAYPLYGNSSQVITPINQVLLTFSTKNIKPGTVIDSSYSIRGLSNVKAAIIPGILIDLTGVSEREVSFDINKGWDYHGGTWGEKVDGNFVPLLIKEDFHNRQR